MSRDDEKETDSSAVPMLEVSDEDYAELTEEDSRSTNLTAEESSLGENEIEIIRLLEPCGFQFLSHDQESLIFRRSQESTPLSPATFRRRKVPRIYAGAMLEQLRERIDELSGITGLMIPSQGYIELVLRSRVTSPRAIATRLFNLEAPELACRHQDSAYALPSLPFRMLGEEGEAERRIHLSGKDGIPCLEISNASPLGAAFYSRVMDPGLARRAAMQTPFLPTLKIDYSSPVEAGRLERRSQEVARALLYELDVRNGIVMEFDERTRQTGIDSDWRGANLEKIRYPRTKLQYEVSSLFGFASQAIGDQPLAFLSYYQTLEYFIPAAVRQNALKAIRRELRDPSFDEASSESLLRIVAAAEGSISAAEASQFRILLNEYVRAGRLDEFFHHNWGNYFTRQGPIQGVEPINTRNATLSLANQVADRIYQIRNRIVHAKDDPRYGSARVLLPRSAEANALAPDVLLVRLLATEAIAASQVVLSL
jgi:hypothetical protein